jgi:hypothetical protein
MLDDVDDCANDDDDVVATTTTLAANATIEKIEKGSWLRIVMLSCNYHHGRKTPPAMGLTRKRCSLKTCSSTATMGILL